MAIKFKIHNIILMAYNAMEFLGVSAKIFI